MVGRITQGEKRSINNIIGSVQDISYRILYNDTRDKLEILDIAENSRKKYYEYLNNRPKVTENEIKEIEAAITYLKLLHQEVKNDSTYSHQSENIIVEEIPVKKVKVASMYPFLGMIEIKKYIANIFNTTWFKAIIGIIIGGANILWGEYTSLYTTLLVFCIFDMILKCFKEFTWKSMIKSIQYFSMTWIWVAVLNQIDKVQPITAMPKGGILALGTVWLILTELKYITEISSELGFPVPQIIKDILKANKD